MKIMHPVELVTWQSEAESLNLLKLLYEWYLVAVHNNIFPDGLILIEKAKQIVERLNITNFKASNS